MDAGDVDGIGRATSEPFEVRNPVPGREAYDGVFEPNRIWRHYQN